MFVDVNENFRRFVNFSSFAAYLAAIDKLFVLFGEGPKYAQRVSARRPFRRFSRIDVPESDWITQYREKK
jgi:hypothetical protein